MDISHKAGTANGNADGLSHAPLTAEENQAFTCEELGFPEGNPDLSAFHRIGHMDKDQTLGEEQRTWIQTVNEENKMENNDTDAVRAAVFPTIPPNDPSFKELIDFYENKAIPEDTKKIT